MTLKGHPISWPERRLKTIRSNLEATYGGIYDKLVNRSGFLDASVLGEVVQPQNFNTLRRIEDEDGKVVEEQEQFVGTTTLSGGGLMSWA